MARDTLRNHPKFKRLVHTLNLPATQVYGILEFIWSVAYESGDEIIGEAIDIKLAADWTGEAETLCDALLNCGGKGQAGFIEVGTDGRYQIHDLYDHAPEYVKKRMDRESARRNAGKTIRDVRADAARKRWNANGSQLHTNSMQTAITCIQKDANGTPPAPAPAPAPIKKKECSEPFAPLLASPPPSFPNFPTVGSETDPKTWALPDELVAALTEAYPGVDVPAECRKVHVWAITNPKKRKTASGMPRCLNLWMAKEQNQPSGRRAITANGRPGGHHPVIASKPRFERED
jgi:hypothetical protein